LGTAIWRPIFGAPVVIEPSESGQSYYPISYLDPGEHGGMFEFGLYSSANILIAEYEIFVTPED